MLHFEDLCVCSQSKVFAVIVTNAARYYLAAIDAVSNYLAAHFEFCLRSEDLKLLSKCCNPSCSAAFRYLHDGKVFVLENDPAANLHRPKRPEYFWLCHDCSSKMTLRLGASHTVEAILLSPATHGRLAGAVVFCQERSAGMILRSLTFPQFRRSRTKKRSELRHFAA